MKRIGLFLLTNIAVIAVASITLSILGVGSFLDESGTNLDLQSLLIFCFVFGMAGAGVSLLLSKKMAIWTTGVKIIDMPSTQQERWLMDTTRELATRAGIGMPDVGIFPMEQSNAFATGANRNKALMAVSSGMLQRFDRNELRAVIGHEIAHIANGDMITMTLLQGIINTFVMFLARVAGFIVDRVVLKNERGLGIGYYITTIVMEILLMILASVIIMYFSRVREFKADAYAAKLTRKEDMIGALRSLKREMNIPDQMPESLNAFGINAGKRQGIKALFMTHPPLDDRIAALERLQV
ncbi:MAG: heat shock protein HtpX [Bacteroidetes bacterium HLUCCA01]|nr:MAG: heat shock protein HtpX [Bacteroidetes bacterium HLUCCA01]